MVISEDYQANYGLLAPTAFQDGSRPNYQPWHESQCHDQNHCLMIGPDMGEVYRILRDRHNDNEHQKFPILKIRKPPDGAPSIVVKSWSSDCQMPFATISHMWPDGLGNEDSNKIYSCQLKFICRLLSKVSKSGSIGQGAEMSTIPFWMDALLIPVQKKPPGIEPVADFKRLKK
jgi:hypothetical protein